MDKDYHEQTDQFEMELSSLIDKYTLGDADGPDKEVMNSPLQPRLNFQTIIGCLIVQATELSNINALTEIIDDDSAEDEGSPSLP